MTDKKELTQEQQDLAKLPVSAVIPEYSEVYFSKRAARLDLEHQADDLKKEEYAARDMLRSYVEARGSDLEQHDNVRVTPGEALVPNIENWEQTLKWIRRNKAWHLLNKQISVDAYREYRSQGVEIPGVKDFKRPTVNINKIKK